MCLYIISKHGGRKNPRPMRATEHYEARKVLRLGYVRKDSKIVQTFRSPYRSTAYYPGKMKSSDIVLDNDNDIHQGLHGYRNGQGAGPRYNPAISPEMASWVTRALYAIIPRGSLVYYGTGNEFVSTHLVVFRTREEMLAWCEKHADLDVAAPLTRIKRRKR